MKSKGIIRQIDDVGRICIPKEFRKSLKIEDREELEITLVKDGILLKKEELMEELERRSLEE